MSSASAVRRERAGDRRAVLKLCVKFVLGAAAPVAVVSLVGHAFRPELERMGRAFLERFGHAGIALGTYVASPATRQCPAEALS